MNVKEVVLGTVLQLAQNNVSVLVRIGVPMIARIRALELVGITVGIVMRHA